MAWLIIVPILISPFVFASYYRRIWARIGLGVVWLSCGTGACFFFRGASELARDLTTVHRYELPYSPGAHTVSIRRLSQGSMLGLLEGGEGRPSRASLERLKWKFSADVVVDWFELPEHEALAASESALFKVGWPQARDPILLTYQVEPADAELLKSRRLVVRHDSSAIHMLGAHGSAILSVLGWMSALWGALWVGVQLLAERKRRRPAYPLDATSSSASQRA